MNTISNSNHASISLLKKETTKSKTFSKFWQDAEYNRFGIIPMLLTVVAIISGVGAAFAQGDTLKLCMVAFPTMMVLTSILSVSPMKLIFYSSAIALLFDLLVIYFR